MAGSAAEPPTQPDAQLPGQMRASDAERDAVVARLTEGFAAGRLSHDTFMYRITDGTGRPAAVDDATVVVNVAPPDPRAVDDVVFVNSTCVYQDGHRSLAYRVATAESLNLKGQKLVLHWTDASDAVDRIRSSEKDCKPLIEL